MWPLKWATHHRQCEGGVKSLQLNSLCETSQAKAGVDKAAGAAKDAAGNPGGKLQGAAGNAKSAAGSLKQVEQHRTHSLDHCIKCLPVVQATCTWPMPQFIDILLVFEGSLAVSYRWMIAAVLFLCDRKPFCHRKCHRKLIDPVAM